MSSFAAAAASSGFIHPPTDDLERAVFIGLGGGLDVVNAGLAMAVMNGVYAKMGGGAAYLGSIRPGLLPQWTNVTPLGDGSTAAIVKSDSKFTGWGRYAEPKAVSAFGSLRYMVKNECLYIGRGMDCESGPSYGASFVQGFNDIVSHASANALYFVDGGGDSLIFRDGDAIKASETTDPELGGDAAAMRTAMEWATAYDPDEIVKMVHVVTAAGIDISLERFDEYRRILASRGDYFGRYNTFTDVFEDWKGYDGEDTQSFVAQYREACDSIVEMNPQPGTKTDKFVSRTAHITRRASAGQFGKCTTGVPWEDAAEGSMVHDHQAWIYFFDFRGVMRLKAEMRQVADAGAGASASDI